jgi:cytochrome c5
MTLVTDDRTMPTTLAFRATFLRSMLATTCALTASSAAIASPGRTGAEVYETVCVRCHASGKDKAPVIGDAKAWKPLIAEGQRELVRTAIKGIRKMPARGGDPTLSDAEVERAVVHMANAAGGRFKARD